MNTRRTRRADITQTTGQGGANFGGQWQALQPLAPAPHDDLAALPIQIFQGHGHDLAATQPEPGQKQQDRVVALAGR